MSRARTITAVEFLVDTFSRAAPLRCVLFDLDGTLYDSARYNEYFDAHGAREHTDHVNRQLLCLCFLLLERKRTTVEHTDMKIMRVEVL
jgi:FMN phosphatase YigB (HAD superfamily)